MYDPKYCETQDRKIETLEDALTILIAGEICGVCSTCPVQMYKCGRSCGQTSDEAKDIVKEQLGIDPNDSDEILYAVCKRLGAPEPKPEPEPEPQAISACSKCANSVMHPSGIRWCNSFCNFVHEDGFCYKFEGVDSDV